MLGHALAVSGMSGPDKWTSFYRVRARDAQIRVMRRTTLTSTCKDEVVEPHTIAIIARKASREYY